MNIIVRFATPEDVKILSGLWEQMVHELAPDYTPRRDWWESLAEELLKTSAYKALMAIDTVTGIVVGFLDGFLFPEPSTGKLHAVGQHFFVLPEYRNTTVARRLYAEAYRVAKVAGASVMELFCFPKERRFWNRHGFESARVLMRRNCNV